MKFSANLGFLWTERPLLERVERAATAGFDAVECHFPYDVEPQRLRDCLEQHGLPLISLNTAQGEHGATDFGVAARPDRVPEARALIDQAVNYAAESGCAYVSVLAGRSERSARNEVIYRDNLRHAADIAARAGLGILIEPISQHAVPGYYLSRVEDALDTIAAIGAPNIQILFDCYHVQIAQGDLDAALERCLPVLGHLQIAAVPDRGEPDRGEIDYGRVLKALQSQGWTGAAGAEYIPRNGSVEAGLEWLSRLRMYISGASH